MSERVEGAGAAGASVEIAQVLALHRAVQWSGWRLWLLRFGREPRAYVKSWCAECHKEWPCPTAEILGVVCRPGGDVR